MIQTDAEQCCCHSRIRIGEQRVLAARLLAMPRAFPSEQLMLCGIMVGVEDNLFVFDETREGHWDVLLLINTYKHIHAHTRTLWLLRMAQSKRNAYLALQRLEIPYCYGLVLCRSARVRLLCARPPALSCISSITGSVGFVNKPSSSSSAGKGCLGQGVQTSLLAFF